MNVSQLVQTRTNNGYGRRRVDRDNGGRVDNKLHHGKSGTNGGKGGYLGGPSRDRLIYVLACLVGHTVEVHVKNGSIISGIFHAVNVESDFGIILKMARVIKDGTLRGLKPVSETIKKPQDMIIPAKELVQIFGKNVTLSSDESISGNSRDKCHDLLIDSAISRSNHVEVERELQPWTPDEDVPECPELENIFDGTWNRKWDQFETNETLFGVKSTFNEELYTTKLDRGPQTRELEKEASRIAREIEDEETDDLHLAEERGIHFNDDCDLDEEIRFSAVQREIDDGRLIEDVMNESHKEENFKVSLENENTCLDLNISKKKAADEVRVSSTCSSIDEEASSNVSSVINGFCSLPDSYSSQPAFECFEKKSLTMDNDVRFDDKPGKNNAIDKGSLNNDKEMIASGKFQVVKSDEGSSQMDFSTCDSSSRCAQESKNSTIHPPVSGNSSTLNDATNSSRHLGGSVSNGGERPGNGLTSTCRSLSPNSSFGSLSSEKFTLNPYAKEFKLNPNARSFTPGTSLRPLMPPDGSFYYPSNVAGIPHMHSMPMSVGIGPSFGGHQTVVYPQNAQMHSQQTYIHPNGALYGQQMVMGQSRPVFYMPSYTPEMAYKEGNF